MSPAAIALVLAAAIAHASWNLFGKQAAETGAAFFVWLLAVCAGCIYLPVVVVTALVTRPHLTGMNWLFLAGTGLLHGAYFLFLQLGYRLGDLSLVYPIGRGTGALLAALAGIVLLGERPTLIGYRGHPRDRRRRRGHRPASQARRRHATAPVRPAGTLPSAAGAVGFALVTGLFIGCYTIWDKYAVATLHTAPVLQGYAGFPGHGGRLHAVRAARPGQARQGLARRSGRRCSARPCCRRWPTSWC